MLFSIEKSLWPLIVGLRVLGFHVGPASLSSSSSGIRKRSSSYSVCLLFTGSLMVLSTVALHCTSFVYGVLRLKANEIGANGTNLTTTKLLNIGIEHLNYTWVLIGVHVTFFYVTLTSGWSELWDTLIVIEDNLKFNSTFYIKCRRSVLIGFGFLFLVIYLLKIQNKDRYVLYTFDIIITYIGLRHPFIRFLAIFLLGHGIFKSVGSRFG